VSWPSHLWLIRHGQSLGNVADDAARRAHADLVEVGTRDPDVELTELGRRQAQAIGREWADQSTGVPDVVLASPYVRAYSTAQIALQEARLDPEIRTDERLRERDLGVFDGLTSHGITDLYPDEAKRRAYLGKFYYRPPCGESWADLALRVRSVLRDIRDEHEGQRVAVFSHQAVLFVFRYVLESLTESELLGAAASEPLHNGAFTEYVSQNDEPLTLVGHDQTHHLEAHDATPSGENDVHGEI
jgi:2,3-bisphosphoglycerate-dependent phosphoglycerate mutase